MVALQVSSMGDFYICQDLVLKILERCSVQSLFKCRCVCKSWKSTIDSATFRSHHLSLQRPRILLQNQNLEYLLLDSDHPGLYDTLQGPDGVQLGETRVLRGRRFHLNAVCTTHGVICLYDSAYLLTLWNPSTRQHLRIPTPPSNAFGDKDCGLWIDGSTNEFKICIIDFMEQDIALFSSKNQVWTQISMDKRFMDFYSEIRSPHILIADMWLSTATKLTEDHLYSYVVCFAFEMEELVQIFPLPKKMRYADLYLSKWNGLPSAIHTELLMGDSLPIIEIWTIIEDGSWSSMLRFSPIEDIKGLCILDSGLVLTSTKDGDLMLYDHHDKAQICLRSTKNGYPLKFTNSSSLAYDFVESFVFPNCVSGSSAADLYDAEFSSWMEQCVLDAENALKGKRWSSQPHSSSIHQGDSKPPYRASSYPEQQILPQQLPQHYNSEPVVASQSSFNSLPPSDGRTQQSLSHHHSLPPNIPSLTTGSQLTFSAPNYSSLNDSILHLAGLSHARGLLHQRSLPQLSPSFLNNHSQNEWISRAGLLHASDAALLNNILQQQLAHQNGMISSPLMSPRQHLQQTALHHQLPSLARFPALHSQLHNVHQSQSMLAMRKYDTMRGMADMREQRPESTRKQSIRFSQQISEPAIQKSDTAQFKSKYMTAEEIDSILKMQHTSHSKDPYIDDYYHQASFVKRSGSRVKIHFSLMHLRDLSSQRNNTDPHSHQPLDSLGRLASQSVQKPRPLLELNPPSGSADGTSDCRPLEQEPMLAARITLEDAFAFLLDVEDVDRVFQCNPPQDSGAQLRRRCQILLEALAYSLQLGDPLSKVDHAGVLAPADDVVLLRLISLPKGWKFFSRYLKLLHSGSELARILCMAIFRHLRFLFGGLPSDPEAAHTTITLATAEVWQKVFNDAIEALRVSYKKMNPFCVPFSTTNMGSAMLAMDLGWMGPNYSISTACATSNFCILNAANHIIRGEADMMLCGGSDAVIIPIGLGCFVACRALSQRNSDLTNASLHWNMNRDGFVMGEGSGVLLAEELEHALRRGAYIYAEFLGGSFTCDAYHMTEPYPEEKALADDGASKEDINYINAHAMSTVNTNWRSERVPSSTMLFRPESRVESEFFKIYDWPSARSNWGCGSSCNCAGNTDWLGPFKYQS